MFIKTDDVYLRNARYGSHCLINVSVFAQTTKYIISHSASPSVRLPAIPQSVSSQPSKKIDNAASE